MQPTYVNSQGECIEFDDEPCDDDPCDADDLVEADKHKASKPAVKPSRRRR